MSSIQEHWDNIARYERLKSQVRRIISELNLAAGRTDSLKSNIERCYQIDGSGAAMASSVVNLQHDIRETANYLSNSVIPGVDSSIDYERREIQRLEEEERRRREEEERRRREEEEREREEEEERRRREEEEDL